MAGVPGILALPWWPEVAESHPGQSARLLVEGGEGGGEEAGGGGWTGVFIHLASG